MMKFNRSITTYGGAKKKSKKNKRKNQKNKRKSQKNQGKNSSIKSSPKKTTPKQEFDTRIGKMCYSANDVFDQEPFEMSDEEALVTFTPPPVKGQENRSFCYKKENFVAYVRFEIGAGKNIDEIIDPSSKLILWEDETIRKVLNEINETCEEKITLNNSEHVEEYADRIFAIIKGMENSAEEEAASRRIEYVEITAEKEVIFQQLVTTLGKTRINANDGEEEDEVKSVLVEAIYDFTPLISKLVIEHKLNKDLSIRMIDALDVFVDRFQ